MDSNNNGVPRHVGIIMDGNGRWAKSKGLDRLYGHGKGVDSVRDVVKAAVEAGVSYLTIYAFSKENWGRPEKEVAGLMELFCKAINDEIPELKSQGVKLRYIGDREHLSPSVREAIEQSERETCQGQILNLIVAMNYGGRSEIVAATREMAKEVAAGCLDAAAIDEKVFSQHLYTRDIPDPDLIIRTSNEYRISNFLLWQMAYSELYFTEILWPEFGKEAFLNALENYKNRRRRFGLIQE